MALEGFLGYSSCLPEMKSCMKLIKIYKEIDNLEFLIEKLKKQAKSKKIDDRQVLLLNSLPSLRQ